MSPMTRLNIYIYIYKEKEKKKSELSIKQHKERDSVWRNRREVERAWEKEGIKENGRKEIEREENMISKLLLWSQCTPVLIRRLLEL